VDWWLADVRLVIMLLEMESLRELSSDHEEESDMRIVLHARIDAAARGYHQVNVLCRDRDVLVSPRSGAQTRSLLRI